MTSEWQSGEISCNGTRLHYQHADEGGRPAVVLVHGITDSGLCWTPVARLLQNSYTVIMPDARGHGNSAAPEHGYSYPVLAEDLACVVRELQIAPAVIVGHSMGAMTAALMAAEHPALVLALVLEDPPWRKETPSPQERAQRAADYREAIVAMHAATDEALLQRNRESSPIWSEAERIPWVASKRQVQPQIVEILRLPPPRWPEMAAKIQAPTMLITADPELGAIVTPDVADEAVSLLSDGLAVRIGGAGHNIRREAFGAYMAAVKDFVTRAVDRD